MNLAFSSILTSRIPGFMKPTVMGALKALALLCFLYQFLIFISVISGAGHPGGSTVISDRNPRESDHASKVNSQTTKVSGLRREMDTEILLYILVVFGIGSNIRVLWAATKNSAYIGESQGHWNADPLFNADGIVQTAIFLIGASLMLLYNKAIPFIRNWLSKH